MFKTLLYLPLTSWRQATPQLGLSFFRPLCTSVNLLPMLEDHQFNTSLDN